MTWIKEQVHFEQEALEATLLDYVHEAEHMAERIQLLDKAIDEAIKKASPAMRAVVVQAPHQTDRDIIGIADPVVHLAQKAVPGIVVAGILDAS